MNSICTIPENCLEWAINHLKNYYDSDFYPKLFEFKSIVHNWDNVKKYLLTIDLNKYIPNSPIYNLAHKSNYSYRVVHQLDPIDSIIFTALVYELSQEIEDFRIPEKEMIACSYRIKTDVNGSFFNRDDNGWENFKSRIEFLTQEFKDGYVLFCDITDFYNQIYTHRIQNVASEACRQELNFKTKVLEKFILGLNKKTSRGIPVGPAPSILLAELIMADIDKEILNHTRNFVRWVDDIRIFFKTKEEANYVLHELSKYLYSPHRLVLSSEKTKVVETAIFNKIYFENEIKQEISVILKEADDLAQEKIREIIDDLEENFGGYNFNDEIEIDYDGILNDVLEKNQIQILSNAYIKIIEINITKEKIEVPLMRHILKKSSVLRIKGLIKIILENFEKFLPVIREVITYLNKVLKNDNIKKYEDLLVKIYNSYYIEFPFVNHWFAYLLQNESFNLINLPSDYKKIITIRDKALIALRKNDRNLIKKYKDNIDTLGIWDKRSVLYSSQILSYDEMKSWGEAISNRGDIIDKSIYNYIINLKKT